MRPWGSYGIIGKRLIIELACDADYQRLANGTSLAARHTIAEALEVLE